MKVIHIESGLGNQMLSFAEYLIVKKLNSCDKCYIETIVYDIPECSGTICQWNGYELKRIFGIDVPNIKECFSDKQWNDIIDDVRKSRFWDDYWRYAPVITSAFKKQGIDLINYHGNERKYVIEKDSLLNKIKGSRISYWLKRKLRFLYKEKYIKSFDCSDKIFIKSDENIYAGQMLGVKNKGFNIGFIEKELKEVFRFPSITDRKNLEILNVIKSTNSVAIHARRGDMLQSNGYCYKFGYFKRAVKYIKQRVENPVFIFFCDTGSIEWCLNNKGIFGLNPDKDDIRFVDWNQGLDSYRDMQLMGYCKHNIITNSSFGWWGTFFNENKNKITISPNVWCNTTVTI